MHTKIQKISKYSPSIFQGRLNLAAVSKPHPAFALEYPVERIILRTLLGFLMLLAICYLYFVAASVLNIISRKEALVRSTHIESSIGTLEGEYLALSQAVTPQSAVTLGLIPIADTHYVDRPGNVSIADAHSKKQI